MRLQTFLVGPLILSGSLSTFAGHSTNTPPWEGQYKIKPNETDRMTPADVLGPDGIVYPNWTKCGVQGGIPTSTIRRRWLRHVKPPGKWAAAPCCSARALTILIVP
ncbi:MAG: hypothetical protein ACYTGS_22455 [Planctomycetota bacterium]